MMPQAAVASRREEDVRQETVREDARLVASLMVVGSLLAMGFVLVDVRVVAAGPWRQVALLARMAILVVSLAGAMVLWKTERLSVFDAIATSWAALVLAATSAFNWSRPPEYELYLVWNVILILTLFYLVRIPLRWQLALTGLFLMSEAVLLVEKFGPELGFRGGLWLYYLLISWIAGAMGSHLMAGNRKARWTALTRERQALAELRVAMERVRELQAIVPVCAQCKSVRDPDGNWEPLAEYISRVTETDVSHTLCPACEDALYPELRDGL